MEARIQHCDMFDWFVALGSNLGDGKARFRCARQALNEGASVIAASPIYETAPMYEKDQPRFLNAALAVRSERGPFEMLAWLQSIEQEHGRQRLKTRRYGPRTLDLDIVAGRQGEIPVIIEEERLQVPHPRMRERKFVLEPLLKLAPEWQHPLLKKSVNQLLESAAGDDTLRAIYQAEEWA